MLEQFSEATLPRVWRGGSRERDSPWSRRQELTAEKGFVRRPKTSGGPGRAAEARRRP
jgi:hypothetical protein